MFRREIMQPRFTSTKAFHDFMLQFAAEQQDYFFYIPREARGMSSKAVIAFFAEAGDEQGTRLAELMRAIYGDLPDLVDVLGEYANCLAD